MSRILLIGGHGKIALRTSPLLAEAGHEVDAVIRDEAQADDVRAAHANPVVADVQSLDPDGLAGLVSGHDVVIWSAGAGGGSAERTYAIDRDAAVRSMDAADRVGIQHYVMVSYFGARPDHGVDPSSSFFAYAEAKAAADEHLRGSGLPFTILAPSGLTLDEPTGRIEIGGESGKVTRADVAAVIAAVVERREPLGATIQFNNGATPIDEALSALS